MLRRIVNSPNLSILKRFPQPVVCSRLLSTEDTPADTPTDGEQKISSVLKQKFPNVTELTVEDVSGGCGAFYMIQMEAEEFKGVRTLKRHQMVKDALKEEIKNLHGLKLELKAPS